MLRMLRVRMLVLAVLLLGGVALGSGSFSAKLDVDQLRLELNVEQEVAQVSGWTVFAGSGFAVSTAGVEELQPYTMACRGWDGVAAYLEVCGELRAPIVGDGSILRLFTVLVW